ncbi:DNA-deoxyinosine glycosylase [Novosphingobium flavum]|uniref:DNA-deoxyinosine glycosylase n=1 Tax=Novosphingobium aerophilum TaxID=2839843 RepID=UPI00163A7A54|nr:DNA-deoxyinosine glycosylase [Novosphingobium aerophilum]
MRKAALPPAVRPDTRVLVLGSLPGEASLAAGRYYAHPRNQFWALIGAVIGMETLPALPYEARLGHLLEAGIGLWDTIASAQRSGSLDSAIRAPEAAPLAELATALPSLRAMAFNGAKAARTGRAAMAGTGLAGTGLALIDLPSSSPAHAARSLAEKREHWLRLQHFLG